MKTHLKKRTILFCIGGIAYNLIEMLWRGRSHWSMFIAGGTCFHIIGGLGKRLKKKGIPLMSGACAVAVTGVEYIIGCIVNLWWKLNVWDYSQMVGNVHGQVCLLYSVLWGAMSIPVVALYERLDGWLGQLSANGQSAQRGERASQISLPNSTSR